MFTLTTDEVEEKLKINRKTLSRQKDLSAFFLKHGYKFIEEVKIGKSNGYVLEAVMYYEYTKQEVQQFLGSKATDNTRLINQLANKGITATTNNKRGVNLLFICDKELENSLSDEFEEFIKNNLPNFKTDRPQLASYLWRYSMKNKEFYKLSYETMAKEMNEIFDTSYCSSNVGKVYNDFVKVGYFNPKIRTIVEKKKRDIKEEDTSLHKLYFIIDKRSEKTVYIGITNNLQRRMKEHFIIQPEKDKPLYKLFDKEGVDNFKMEVRAVHKDRFFIEEMERQLITFTPDLLNVIHNKEIVA